MSGRFPGSLTRSGLAFPTPHGDPMRRSNFRRRVWSPATAATGLEGLRFHDLRHTAVALAIRQGAHPKAIQERMGHSSVIVTLDRYGHLYDGLDSNIAAGLDEILRESRGLHAAPPPSDRAHGPQLRGKTAGQRSWALRDSNPRPPPCKGGALAS